MQKQPKLKKRRAYHTLTFCNGHYYAVGGSHGETRMRDCERWSGGDKDKWEMVSPLANEQGRAGHAACTIGGKHIYVFGGDDTQTEPLDSIE